MSQKAKSKPSGTKGYKETLRTLQVELVKLQKHLIKNDLQILILFEGRDAAGKDGVIKRITEHLPSTGELVLMHRSWYNRAGVERVMGYCTETEHEGFMRSVLPFEHMLVDSGIQLFKYYLDISKDEQTRRLKDRRVDPLKQWKISPVDKVAIKHWNDYSAARNEMFARTHNEITPWHVVRADNKKQARLNVIRHLMSLVDCPDKDEHAARPDQDIVFTFDQESLSNGKIAL